VSGSASGKSLKRDVSGSGYTERTRESVEEQEQRRLEQEQCRLEQERRRIAEEQRRELWSQLALEVDSFIRTRRKFTTAKPTHYLCRVSTIECELQSQIAPRFGEWRTLLEEYEGTLFAFSTDRQSVHVVHLTPFQGESSHRVFGEFSCSCGKRWKSAATWKDKWQQCKACETKVYPHKQHVLKTRDKAEADEGEARQPHDMARCQKCREKGSLCVPHLYYAVS